MTSQPPQVSAVVCAYTFDRLNDVVEAVQSLESQQPRLAEIIVVVDHNPDLKVEIRSRLADEIIVIENGFDPGLSGARNSGVAQAGGEYIFFLDDDAVAAPDCVALLTRRCVESGAIGASAHIEPALLAARPSWFPSEFLWVVGCSYEGLQPGPTRNLLGAAMCLRRDIFDRVGGFDASLGRSQKGLPHGCEETEFCIRATKETGGVFIHEPAARILHKVPAARLTVSYFSKRCYAEGMSKARLSTLAGSERSLASERAYVAQTLTRSVAQNLGDVGRRMDPAGMGRAGAVALGLGCAGAGYARGRLSNALGAQHALLFNAALLSLGTGISAALGFFYWLLAARSFPAEAVGYAAAAISLMNFIGHLGEVGLGALLMGKARSQGARARNFITAGLLLSCSFSALFAFVYLGLNALFKVSLGEIASSSGAIIFILACGLTGLTLVLDQSLVGLMRSQLQVSRNVAFAVTKLILLAGAPLLLGAAGLDEKTIFLTWFAGQLASILLLAAFRRGSAQEVVGRPDFHLLGSHFGDVLGHHGLNMANLAPSLLLPFLVTVVLSPSINAAFYASWTLINVAYLAPASLATMVYAVGAKSPAELAERIRTSLGVSMAIGLGVAAVCWIGAEFILSLFSPAYAAVAADSFRLLGLSFFLIAIKYHYVAIQRVRNQMLSASVLVSLGCVLELGGALFGGRGGDLHDLTLGWLLGLLIETAAMAPVVFRVLQIGGTAPGLAPRGAPQPAYAPATVAAGSEYFTSQGLEKPR
jgi:O-antigen/teichoic acid export membrane protein